MATSLSYNFTQTCNDICTKALVKIGVCAENLAPTGQQLTGARQQLNLIIKELENVGFKIWGRERKTFNTVVSQSTYTLADGVSEANDFYYRISSEDTSIEKISLSDYEAITNKAEAGKPEKVVHNISRTTSTVTFYPVPSSILSIYYTAIMLVQDMDSAINEPDTPPAWYNMLVYGLASELADDYQLPLEERLMLQRKAADKLESARGRMQRIGKADMEVVKGRF